MCYKQSYLFVKAARVCAKSNVYKRQYEVPTIIWYLACEYNHGDDMPSNRKLINVFRLAYPFGGSEVLYWLGMRLPIFGQAV